MTLSDPQISAKRRWLKRGLFVAFAIVVAGFALRNQMLGTPVETYEAARGNLIQTVVASGRITTPQRISVGAVITERVARIPVSEGQSVRRGDILIELDDTNERASVAQARAALAQAEAKLRQLREVALPAAEQSLVQAQANALQARRQYDRTKDLRTKGFISQASLDDAQRNLDVAESQLRAARIQIQTNSRGGSDFVLAQTALEQARASLRVAQARLDQTVIRAKTDGVLIGRNVEPGDVVQPGKELMVLAPAGETQVVLQVDERNLSQLSIGQHALGSADAFPDRRFAAELFYINPGVDALRGSVEVKLRVPRPPDYLRQDMTVSMDIEVARRNDTIIVPTDAVHDLASDRPWVLAVVGHRALRRSVKLGLKGNAHIEVLDGVAPGDRLIPATNVAIAAGQRVRIMSAGKDATP